MLLAESAAVTTVTTIKEALIVVVSLFILALIKVVQTKITQWADAQIEATKSESQLHQVESHLVLANRAKAFIAGTAKALAEREFPKLAAAIESGNIKTPELAREVLTGWGREVRDAAVAHFKDNGVDIVAEFSVETLDNWIERAANISSPAPGMTTTKALFSGLAHEIHTKGVEVGMKAFLAGVINGQYSVSTPVATPVTEVTHQPV